MKRFKVNTTFEENENVRRQFFADLSYIERLRYYFKLRNMTGFQEKNTSKVNFFKVYYSHNAV